MSYSATWNPAYYSMPLHAFPDPEDDLVGGSGTDSESESGSDLDAKIGRELEECPDKEFEADAMPDPDIEDSNAFVPGQLLRWSPIKVRLDPSRGWSFEGSNPPFPPAYLSLFEVRGQPARRAYVGMTHDGAPAQMIAKLDSGSVVRRYPNEPVLLVPDTRREELYRLIDNMGITINEKYVVFNEGWKRVEGRTLGAKRLSRRSRRWKKAWLKERGERRRAVDQKRREWEIEFLKREWFERGNTIIFSPDTTDEKVEAAIKKLEQMIARVQACIIPFADLSLA
ncbi:hypothetical protein FQN49_001185 [Arthroderma sp. PD_2]|nr:hypothetical protein FQN49_001185 [Arthroderma sp. PD_2]